jgi:hypothetical protein
MRKTWREKLEDKASLPKILNPERRLLHYGCSEPEHTFSV